MATRVSPCPLNETVPSVVLPFLKVTVPRGLLPVTVAVRVVVAPARIGLALDCSVVTVTTMGAASAGGAAASSMSRQSQHHSSGFRTLRSWFIWLPSSGTTGFCRASQSCGSVVVLFWMAAYD